MLPWLLLGEIEENHENLIQQSKSVQCTSGGEVSNSGRNNLILQTDKSYTWPWKRKSAW